MSCLVVVIHVESPSIGMLQGREGQCYEEATVTFTCYLPVSVPIQEAANRTVTPP